MANSEIQVEADVYNPELLDQWSQLCRRVPRKNRTTEIHFQSNKIRKNAKKAYNLCKPYN